MLKEMVHIVNVPYPFQALLLLAPPTLALISSVRCVCVVFWGGGMILQLMVISVISTEV
jgi:hypothetical protein